MIVFTASEVRTEADDDALVCCLRGHDTAGHSHYLLLQRDALDSPDDWGVHLEVDDQGHGDYGLVQQCVLAPSRLTVALARPLPGYPGVSTVSVAFSLDAHAFAPLRTALQGIFRGTPLLVGPA